MSPATIATAPAGLIPYDPAADRQLTVNLAVATFTLLTLTGATGLAMAGSSGALGIAAQPGTARGAGAGKVASVTVEYVKGSAGSIARGDASRLWRFPWTHRLDGISLRLPKALAGRAPLMARLATDGSYLRAMVGSLYMLLPVAGLALGVQAGLSTAGLPLPLPSVQLLLILLILGVVDAFSGFVAVLAFAVTVGASGELASFAALRLLLGLGGLWFVTPLVAGAARPLRRVPSKNLAELWDHGADFAIGSLVGAWAVQKLVLGLPGLAGYRLPVADQANTAAVIVLLALLGRFAAETLAANLYPRRLGEVQPSMTIKPGPRQRLLSSLLRAGLFTFVMVAFIGLRWQLVVGAALFLVPQVLTIYEGRFPNSLRLRRLLPRGILKTVVMLFVGSVVAGLALRLPADPHELLADVFVVCSLPGFVLALAGLFGHAGPDRPLTWGHRAAGVFILGIGVAYALGIMS